MLVVADQAVALAAVAAAVHPVAPAAWTTAPALVAAADTPAQAAVADFPATIPAQAAAEAVEAVEAVDLQAAPAVLIAKHCVVVPVEAAVQAALQVPAVAM